MKHRTRFRAVAAFLLVLMLLVPQATPARAASSSEIKGEIADLKKENSAIQAEINAIRKQYDANASEMQAIVDQKNAIDQEILLLNQQIINVNEQIAAYGQLIADTQEELEVAQGLLDELNEQNRLRIRAMEEEGSVSYWEVLFQANSFTDLLDRLNMVEEIAVADQRRLEEMRLAAEMVERTRAELNASLSELQAARDELALTQQMLEERRDDSDDLLRQLIEKRDEFQVLLDESEAAQDELMREIAQKEKELKQAQYDEYLAKLAAQGSAPPSNAKWFTPLSSYTLTSPFGMRKHPVLGYNRMHNGIDMAAPQGTPIYATRAGKVTTASYQAGGAGYYVSINHLDGFASIYMHMTHYVVSAGQTVSQGQLIGYVGSTGISTGPHLHFGISYAGTYVNPLAYIY